MNCLDCRRLLLTQPHARSAELAAHLRACPTCARWAAGQARFEKRLQAALRLPVADNLQDRVRLETSLRGRRPARRRLMRAAVIAAVGIGLGVGLGLGGWEYQASRSLTGALAARMRPSPRAGRAHAMTDPELARLTARLGRYLHTIRAGGIVAASQSVIDGRQAAYLRIAHGSVRASIFLLPHASLALEHDVRANGTPGRLIPTGYGVVAVFCPDRRMLIRVASDLRSAARWRG